MRLWLMYFALALALYAVVVPRSHGAEPLKQCTLSLPQSTLAMACPCPDGGACSCPPGQCNCPGCKCDSCPAKAPVLADFVAFAIQQNKRLVVWTGCDGRSVPGCVNCRNDNKMPRSQAGRSVFVTVGVPSADGLTWWQLPADTADLALQTIRTDGEYERPVKPVNYALAPPPMLSGGCPGGRCH